MVVVNIFMYVLYVDDVYYFFSLFIRVVSVFFFVWRVYEI